MMTGELAHVRPEASPAECQIPVPPNAPFDASNVAPRHQLASIVLDILGPAVVYYVAHGLGASNMVALTAGSSIPATSALYSLVVKKRVDGVAVGVCATIVLTVGLAVASGNPRFILAKDGIITGAWGGWFLISARTNQPAAYLFARPLMEGRRIFGEESWSALWQQVPEFRQVWKVASLIWGGALLLDAMVRALAARFLPVSFAPALNGALYPVTLVVVQIVTNIHYTRAGLFTMLGARWARPFGSPIMRGTKGMK